MHTHTHTHTHKGRPEISKSPPAKKTSPDICRRLLSFGARSRCAQPAKCGSKVRRSHPTDSNTAGCRFERIEPQLPCSLCAPACSVATLPRASAEGQFPGVSRPVYRLPPPSLLNAIFCSTWIRGSDCLLRTSCIFEPRPVELEPPAARHQRG